MNSVLLAAKPPGGGSHRARAHPGRAGHRAREVEEEPAVEAEERLD
jgi:hypothetical protein